MLTPSTTSYTGASGLPVESAPALRPTILVVEDEPHIRELVCLHLDLENLAYVEAADGDAGLKLARERHFDLVILDLMLPRMNGYELCRRVRDEGITTPILMLTARNEEMDRVLGLDLGADDYVSKPFSTRELTARIKAALRRSQAQESAVQVFENGRIRVDVGGQTLVVDGEAKEVSTREFRLLRYLIDNRGRVLSRDQILNKVWGYDYFGTARTIDNFITKLRQKIGELPEAPRHIITVRGVGYKFVA